MLVCVIFCARGNQYLVEQRETWRQAAGRAGKMFSQFLRINAKCLLTGNIKRDLSGCRAGGQEENIFSIFAQ